MINREHDLPITKQAQVLRISRGSVYYLTRDARCHIRGNDFPGHFQG